MISQEMSINKLEVGKKYYIPFAFGIEKAKCVAITPVGGVFKVPVILFSCVTVHKCLEEVLSEAKGFWS